MNLLGSINTENFIDDLTYSTFDAADYLDDNGRDFDSWTSLYGPEEIDGDLFTSLFQFNLSDTRSYLAGLNLPITGFGAPIRPMPFAAEDIIILTNGMCSSACSNFVELMTSQGNVKTIALGGRPRLEGMAAVGGVQGGVVMSDDQIGLEASVAYRIARGYNEEVSLPLSRPSYIKLTDAA